MHNQEGGAQNNFQQNGSSSLSGNLAEVSRTQSKGQATGQDSLETQKERSDPMSKEQAGQITGGEQTSNNSVKPQVSSVNHKSLFASIGQTSGITGTDKEDTLTSGLDLNNLRNLMENYKPPF